MSSLSRRQFGKTSIPAARRRYGGTEWISAEQEFCVAGKSPMECAELSLAGFEQLV
jgi:hypothetical protein